MSYALPQDPRQLRGMLARRLGAAAVAIGLATGGAFHAMETHRMENASLDRAAAGARHFESSAMQVVLGAGAPGAHSALSRLLDRTRFVGIRVFGADRALVYEAWEDIPPVLVDAARSEHHDWPAPGGSHRNWVEVAGERLILVVLPLTGDRGRLVGYVESVSRLDASALQAQRDRALDAALTSATSVLVTALLLYPLMLAMLRRSVGLSRRLLDSNLSLIRSLGNAVAKRDSGTDAHNYRVTLYAVALAEALGLPKKEIADLVAGAFLHDVGKIGIPDRILLNPGKLTAGEFEIMKTHVPLGMEIVADNPWLEGAASTIRHHHERFDGGGYPNGLEGESIPRAARIFAVADVFDALTSDRPYRRPMALGEAMKTIERESGRHFDPDVVVAFMVIARDKHTAACQADDATLRLMLGEVLSRYFVADSLPETGDSRFVRLGKESARQPTFPFA
jgi:HD-GYP domain-containing protein (c-di-GMP phosphodiesterase class II)